MMKEKLTLRHQQLLNCEPTFYHLELYEAAPKKRGFTAAIGMTPEQEAKLFEAVFVLALEQTFVPSDHKMPNVYLFVPPSLEGWAAQQLKNIAARMFDICKHQAKVNREYGVAKAKLIANAYRHVLLGSRLNVATTPPDHWVAFGFEREQDLPDWVLPTLIPLSPILRDD